MGLLDDAIREHLDLKRARGADPTEIERLEREALGPVRRDRPMGTAQPDAPGQYELERTPAEEHLGYPDGRAPDDYADDLGSHQNHEHDAPPLNLAGAHAPEQEAPQEEAPRRRGFLRRGRPAAAPDPAELEDDDHGYADGPMPFEPAHDEPLLPDEHLLHDEPLPRDEHLLHDEHAEPLSHDEPPLKDELPPVRQPPPLAFDAPPARPRFTPEPPTTVHVRDEEPAHGNAEPGPTREFDVLAETAPEAEAEEDVLEETPEFLQDTPEHDRLWFEQRPPRDFDFDG